MCVRLCISTCLCACVCVVCVCGGVPLEVRRQHEMPWRWSDTRLYLSHLTEMTELTSGPVQGKQLSQWRRHLPNPLNSVVNMVDVETWIDISPTLGSLQCFWLSTFPKFLSNGLLRRRRTNRITKWNSHTGFRASAVPHSRTYAPL